MHYTTFASPVGPLLLAADDRAVQRISFSRAGKAEAPEPGWERAAGGSSAAERLLRRLENELERYFAGELRDFTVAVEPPGTEFQQRVWRALRRVPYGRTVSYGEVAQRLGQPTASRAVGAANGRNPIPIVIPCHRVIGADGRLTGFGGGLAVKERLLALERRGLAREAGTKPARARTLRTI